MILRPATSDDLRYFPDVASAAPHAGAIVVDVGGRCVAAGVLDPQGGPMEPGVPRLVVAVGSTSPDTAPALSGEFRRQVLTILVEELVARARVAGVRRVLLAWDTLDVVGQQALSQLGFKPGSTWPYFPPARSSASIAGAMVEYVTGYRDPAGSVVDLDLELAMDQEAPPAPNQ